MGIILAWPDARFQVCTDQVVIDARDRTFAADLLIPAVWSVVLAASGQESLHACALAREGRAIAVLGSSGAGKSTAALRLHERGWRVVTDDLLAVTSGGDAIPGPPFLRLAPDQAFGRLGHLDSRGKLRVDVPACRNPVPLGAMVVLDEDYVACRPLTGVAAVEALLNHIYSPLVIDSNQVRRRLELVVDLVGRVPVYGAPPRSLTVDSLERIAGEA